MELKYNLTGADRKRLVKAISEITEVPAKYLGAPSFAYQVDYFTIDRNGSVSFDNRADSEEAVSYTHLDVYKRQSRTTRQSGSSRC